MLAYLFESFGKGKARAWKLAPLAAALFLLGCGGGSDDPAAGGTRPGSTQVAPPPQATPTPRAHVVVSGDTLSVLCDALVPELSQRDCLEQTVSLNGLADAGQIQVGQELILPGDPAAAQQAQAGSTPRAPAPAGPTASPTPLADRCGAPANPYNFSFCDTGGAVIIAPPQDICDHLVCSEAFWQERGFIVECSDGVFSKAGGTSSACLGHGAAGRALKTP